MNEAIAKLGPWKERLKKFAVIAIATGGFVGYFPIAPGTAGTLAGVLILWWLGSVSWWALLLLSLGLGAAGVWASGYAKRLWGESDSGHVVIDEIVGFLIGMIGMPITGYWLFWGFLLFRIFDVLKIPPGNYFDERVKNGWGVVLDDVTAGIYTNVILHLMLRAQL